MACGENPKRIYGERNLAPSTRMGNVAAYRAQWVEAQKYILDWQEYESCTARPARQPKLRPARDLRLDTLAAVLTR